MSDVNENDKQFVPCEICGRPAAFVLSRENLRQPHSNEVVPTTIKLCKACSSRSDYLREKFGRWK